MSKKTVKVTLNLPADLVERLKKESDKKQVSMTEEIRRNLESGLYLSQEEEEGAKILIEKKDSRIVQLVRK
jgi:hypothetical protein